MFCNAETFCVSAPEMGCEGPLPPDASPPLIDSSTPGDVAPPGDVMMPQDDVMPVLADPRAELLPVATDSVTTVRESADDVRR